MDKRNKCIVLFTDYTVRLAHFTVPFDSRVVLTNGRFVVATFCTALHGKRAPPSAESASPRYGRWPYLTSRGAFNISGSYGHQKQDPFRLFNELLVTTFYVTDSGINPAGASHGVSSHNQKRWFLLMCFLGILFISFFFSFLLFLSSSYLTKYDSGRMTLKGQLRLSSLMVFAMSQWLVKVFLKCSMYVPNTLTIKEVSFHFPSVWKLCLLCFFASSGLYGYILKFNLSSWEEYSLKYILDR